MEEMQYDAWKAGRASLTPPDWTTPRAAAATSPRGIKRQTDRTNALRVIYKNDSIIVENYAWFHENMDFALPIVCAVVKVQAATRVLGGQQELNSDDLEIQAIQKINAVVMERAST